MQIVKKNQVRMKSLNFVLWKIKNYLKINRPLLPMDLQEF